MAAIPTIVHAIAMPTNAPVDKPLDCSEFVDAAKDALEGVFMVAMFAVDAAEVLEAVVEVMPEEVMSEDVLINEAELLDDVVVTDDRVEDVLVEDVLVGAKVETVAPNEPRVTISVLKSTWKRPIPELQQPSI